MSGVSEQEAFVLSDVAVQELGMSQWAVLKAMQRGTLPARKIGRTWIIRRSDLDAFKQHRSTKRRARTT